MRQVRKPDPLLRPRFSRPSRVLLQIFAALSLLLPALGSHTAGYAQSSPSVILDPTSGPPGSILSVSVTGFPLGDAGRTALIRLDGGAIAHRPLVRCGPSASGGGSGFGAECDGNTAWTAIPAWMALGQHTVAVNEGNFVGQNAPQALLTVVAPDPSRATAPKWAMAPHIDGKCDDPAYAHAGSVLVMDNAGQRRTAVWLLHSGLDFYLCAVGMGAEVDRLVIGVDANRVGAAVQQTPIYQFTVSQAGATSVTQSRAGSTATPLSLSPSEFAARVHWLQTDDATMMWTAEMRISLDWLGGYARTDGLSLSLEDANGGVMAAWPAQSQSGDRSTWGSLVLAPLYPQNVTAGSVFTDGQTGYLVVPYARDLNRQELTIEGWVRVVNGSCGTLVGNGRAVSYWLALCGAVQVGYGQEGDISAGPRPLGDGWHHIAVTIDADGVRTSYVDGQMDLIAGWEKDQPQTSGSPSPERRPRLGVSDRMLRIGSDRDAPSDQNYLHAYIRDLSIWNRPLSAQQIRQTAFHPLQGREQGLLALWHFTSGLQDSAGKHDAGLIGDASLAREAPNVRSFPQPPPARRSHLPPPGPEPAWNARIPYSNAPVKLDGFCRPSEYTSGTTLWPEPHRAVGINLVLRGDGLYICTGPLFGSTQTADSWTLWLDGTGMGGNAPGKSQLRLQGTPDGKVVAAIGDGRGFTGTVLQDVVSDTGAGRDLALQDELSTYHTPWWSTELRVPLRRLAPFGPGRRLRLAVLYRGTVPAGAAPGQRSALRLQESWPKSFDGNHPSTWGVVETGVPGPPQPGAQAGVATGSTAVNTFTAHAVEKLQTPVSALRDRAAGRSRSAAGSAPSLRDSTHMLIPGYTGPSVGIDDFIKRCDGGALGLEYATNPSRKWLLIQDGIEAEGTLDSIWLSKQDSPFIHDSHDLDMQLNLAPGFGNLLLDGGADSTLEIENESRYFPPPFRPSVGDHVTVKGRWDFDCGHLESAHTEIHPAPYFESDHLQARRLGPGPELRTVRVAQVWMNGNPGAFQYDFKDYGPFDFDLQLPSTPPHAWRPFAEVVKLDRSVGGDPAKVKFRIEGSTVHVRIDPPEGTCCGALAPSAHYEIVVGYLLESPDDISGGAHSYTVHLDKIDIVHDHDADDEDGWHLDVAVNGQWNHIFQNANVNEDNPPYDLSLLPFDTTDNRLTIRMTGYKSNDSFSLGNAFSEFDGEIVAQRQWDLGPLSEQVGKSLRLCPTTPDYPGNLSDPICSDYEHGDWVLYYHVTEGPPLSPILASSGFWSPRLAEKQASHNLGELVVARGVTPEYTHDGYITEQKLPYTDGFQPVDSSGPDGLTLLGKDQDVYRFSLGDFGNVSASTDQVNVTADVSKVSLDPWFTTDPSDPWKDDLPNVQATLGSRHGIVTARSVTGHVGDQPYTLRVRSTWRDLPPDWGAAEDGAGGRTVDLATPDPHAGVDAGPPEERTLLMRWAWQQNVNEVHHYRVFLPPFPSKPEGQDKSSCDRPHDQLKISVPGMNLTIPGGGDPITKGGHIYYTDLSGKDELWLTDPRIQFPDGRVPVIVNAPDGHRHAYRLKAHWIGPTYMSPAECAEWSDREHPAVPIFPPDIGEIVNVNPPNAPGGLPRGGWDGTIPGFGGGVLVNLIGNGGMDAIISTPAGMPVTGRLYDANGVLLAESVPLTGDAALRTLGPAGLTPDGRLTVSGLSRGTYYLQISPMMAAGSINQVPAGSMPIQLTASR